VSCIAAATLIHGVAASRAAVSGPDDPAFRRFVRDLMYGMTPCEDVVDDDSDI
jgi:hypothetical protein